MGELSQDVFPDGLGCGQVPEDPLLLKEGMEKILEAATA